MFVSLATFWWSWLQLLHFILIDISVTSVSYTYILTTISIKKGTVPHWKCMIHYILRRKCAAFYFSSSNTEELRQTSEYSNSVRKRSRETTNLGFQLLGVVLWREQEPFLKHELPHWHQHLLLQLLHFALVHEASWKSTTPVPSLIHHHVSKHRIHQEGEVKSGSPPRHFDSQTEWPSLHCRICVTWKACISTCNLKSLNFSGQAEGWWPPCKLLMLQGTSTMNWL